MSSRLSSLHTRLAKVEARVFYRAWRKKEDEREAKCNCMYGSSYFTSAEEFEAAANLPCPTHGVRRLGNLDLIRMLAPSPGVVKLMQRVEEYELRISQLPPISLEVEDDFEEF
jgi:hypothetical protein